MTRDKTWYKLIEGCVKIREFERVIQDTYPKDTIQSPVHLSIGQELTSALIAHFYLKGDYVTGNYRSHGLAVALSDDIQPVISELLAKQNGVSAGKAGSMHLSVPDKNMMWTSAIVGSGVPLSIGFGEYLKRLGGSNVSTVMFGDGAIEEGCVLESLNLASVRQLPVVFILEDNGLAIHTDKSSRTAVNSYSQLAESFNIQHFHATYKSPYELLASFDMAYSHARDSRRPSFLVVDCYRWCEHVGVNDDWGLGYRKEEELQEWLSADIIVNPDNVGVDPEYVSSLETKYSSYFAKLFKDTEDLEDSFSTVLLSNVY